MQDVVFHFDLHLFCFLVKEKSLQKHHICSWFFFKRKGVFLVGLRNLLMRLCPDLVKVLEQVMYLSYNMSYLYQACIFDLLHSLVWTRMLI